MTSKAALTYIFTLLVAPVLTQADQRANAPESLTGRWVVTTDLYGTPIYVSMDIEQRQGKIVGTYGDEKLEGSINGNLFHFISRGKSGSTEAEGRVSNGALSGTIIDNDDGDKDHPLHYSFTATPVPKYTAGMPLRHEFVPTVFYRQYSASTRPVLIVAPGDTIHTTTVDSGGTDEKGETRVLGGNPQTGPFYIESAMPGDTLVVHLTRLRLNREYALSGDGLVSRALDKGLAQRMKEGGNTVRWNLDLTHGVASLDQPGPHTSHYKIPVHPMLGCLATAPAPMNAAPPTGDSGRYGGNMDFNEIVEGATVYLPVSVPGALLYLGDGHAVQGDGELNGDALETSMDVEFTVDVIPGRITSAPRVESSTHIMAMGLAGSLDEAFRNATSNMAQWLSEDYDLSPAETAEVLGSAAEYKVSEVADRNAGIVLKINKERLKALATAK